MQHTKQSVRWLTLSFTLFFSFCLMLSSCETPPPKDPDNGGKDSTLVKDEQEVRLLEGKVDPQKAEGNKYPPQKPNSIKGANNNKYPPVPTGPVIGNMSPEVEMMQMRQIRDLRDGQNKRDDQAAGKISFREYTEIPSSIGNMSTTGDISVAENGDLVMMSGNWWAALSTDGGGSFNALNPTTIFPSADGGFCCDQVLHYSSEPDLFIWLLQYCGDGASCTAGKNRIRIAVASSAQVKSSSGTAWTYWDFPSTQFGTSGILDYPDLAVGSNSLYWSADIVGTGLQVVRTSLSGLAAGGSISYQYTNASDGATAYGSHLLQDGGDEIFWAGHINSSKMRFFSLKEGSGTYFWRDRDVNSWPNSTLTSSCPDKNDWLQKADNFPGNAVIGATRNGRNLWFAWMASSGGGFPMGHVQMVRVDKSDNYKVKEQVQVWNKDFAFAYPYLSSNNRGEIGMSIGFGGGNLYSSHAVGVWGDYVVYYPKLSDICTNRWGDYHTVRRANKNSSDWAAGGYYLKKNSSGNATTVPHYIYFGR